MSKLLTIASGRRAKWIVGAVWLIVIMGVGAGGLPAKFVDAQENESTSFLPGDAESTKALQATEELQGGENAAAIVVYRRASGLTAADRARIQSDRERFNANLPRATAPLGDPVFSPDGRAALVSAVITGDGESDTILDPIDLLREQVSDPGGGLEVKVTGPAGYAADAIKIFEAIDGTLLFAALSLVIVLLILIYRSPIFVFIPLFAVVFAQLAAQGIGYGLTQLGVTVNGQSSSILSVLVLGAGTDYALLLVSRYREELRKHADKHEALALALRTAGPAIFASGLTVIAALLTLTLAEVNATSGLGPIGAVGIAVAMLSMLTLLPAMLVMTGRWAFWRPPIFGWGNGIPHLGDSGADETHGAWRRVGERVARSPRRIWVSSTAILVVCCFGVLNFSDGLNNGNGYRGEVEAVEGQALLAQSFPSGNTAPVDVVVPDSGRAEAVASAIGRLQGVAAVRPAERGEAGVLLNATLQPDPFSKQAEAIIEPLRTRARRAGGPDVLVGGQTAVQLDGREAATRDTLLIVPIALLIVFLILMALLRAVIAPLLLIGTVILSFGAALGVSAIVYDVIFGFPGSDPSLPLYAFVFLVALGIDYNIFLMARVREETQRHGTHRGMIRGLAVTGGVITSAGIVLAGTFSVLGVLPLVFLTQIGFVVAFGVLLDTFLVRSVLVPALVLELGQKIWWPSRLARTDGEHRPEPELTQEERARVAV
jgi:RND superfamily putative drug exporter